MRQEIVTTTKDITFQVVDSLENTPFSWRLGQTAKKKHRFLGG